MKRPRPPRRHRVQLRKSPRADRTSGSPAARLQPETDPTIPPFNAGPMSLPHVHHVPSGSTLLRSSRSCRPRGITSPYPAAAGPPAVTFARSPQCSSSSTRIGCPGAARTLAGPRWLSAPHSSGTWPTTPPTPLRSGQPVRHFRSPLWSNPARRARPDAAHATSHLPSLRTPAFAATPSGKRYARRRARLDLTCRQGPGSLGLMFLLLWNTFSGSYFALISASRR